jgi:hypothetical protein
MNKFQILALVSAIIIILGSFATLMGYMFGGGDDPQVFEFMSNEGKWKQANDTKYKAFCDDALNNYTIGGKIFTGGFIVAISGILLLVCGGIFLAVADGKNQRINPDYAHQNKKIKKI